MNIKTKLRWGFGFLFIIVMLFGIMGIYYIGKISDSSKIILKDNYESLSYISAMEEILDNHDLPLSEDAGRKLNYFFRKELDNITEPGEKREVLALGRRLSSVSGDKTNKVKANKDLRIIRTHLRTISKLNLLAIVKKNEATKEAVKQSAIYLGLIGSFTFLILFTFIVNFPGYIANPLRELSDAIRQISRKNYRQRLYFKTNDEFAELAISFNEMAARLDQWENSNVALIKSEKGRIEAIIENMQDAIIGLNERSEVLFLNLAAQQLLNISREKIIGVQATVIASTNDLLRTIMHSSEDNNPLRIVTNGKESFFNMESRTIEIPNTIQHTEDSPIVTARISAGTVYILRNITQFKERDEAKTNFIATISHELKTPISSIKLSLQLLRDRRTGILTDDQLELIANITDDTGRLLKITSELLDLAQVETGNIQLNLKRSDPMEVVKYAMDAIQIQAQQKEVKLELIARQRNPEIYIDTEKTTWVLINFLSNALRYSPHHSKIIIQVIHQSPNVIFSVKDFGTGIEAKYLDRLFDRYFQVPSDGRNKSGSGLGLAISREFIEAQRGRIFVESAPGDGSKFTFTVPVA